jgi:hypothetical protein
MHWSRLLGPSCIRHARNGQFESIKASIDCFSRLVTFLYSDSREARDCSNVPTWRQVSSYFHDSFSQFHVALRVYPETLLLGVKGESTWNNRSTLSLPEMWLRNLPFSQHVAARTFTRIYSRRLLKNRGWMKNQIPYRIWRQYCMSL